MNRDHSSRFTGRMRYTTEVSIQGRRVVALVDPLEAEAAGQQGVPPGGVDNEARGPSRRALVGTGCRHACATFDRKLDLRHAHAFEHDRAEATAVVEQQLVKIRPPHVKHGLSAKRNVATLPCS